MRADNSVRPRYPDVATAGHTNAALRQSATIGTT
jgi:hypothetical protein